MNAVRPADHHRMLVPQCLPFQDRNHLFQVVEDEVKRLGHLQGQRSVDNIRRGQPHMKESMLRTDRFYKRFEKGDHIVLRHLLDPGDALYIDRGLLPNASRCAARDLSSSFERCAGGQLDCEPNFVLTFQLPDGFHLGTGITVNHLFTTPSLLTPYPLTHLDAWFPSGTPSSRPDRECRSRTSMRHRRRNFSPIRWLRSPSPWPARHPSTAVHRHRPEGYYG